MSQELKLLFDECVGRPIIASLRDFLATSILFEPTFAHILDYQGQGVLDEIWIPRTAAEGWILLSADRGKKPSKGQKLPLLCRQFGMTHILMSAKLHTKSNFFKARTIIAIWPQIGIVLASPKGSGFKLQLTQSGAPKLVQIYSPPAPPIPSPDD